VEAGADGLWVLTGNDADLREMEEIAAAFPDVPLIYCWSVRGVECRLSLDQIESMGFSMVIAPNLMLFGLIAESMRLLTEIKEKGSLAGLLDRIASVEVVDELVGLKEARQFQASLSEPAYVDPTRKQWVMGGHGSSR
jgi:methylisocitrate lyase